MLHRNAVCALALFCFSSGAVALEIGFESQLSVNVSDNVTGVNEADEALAIETGTDGGRKVEGQVGYAQFGVYGEQKGTNLKGAFSGEFITTRRLDDPDADFVAITQFLGAAEFQITPRAFSWYVGDILGSVRADDGLQSIDDTQDERRNVFATGPQFVYELDAFSRVNANFLYVNQTQDDITLESLFNTNASWSFDTDGGNTWGTVFTNIYTDNPEENVEGDFNRFSLSGIWSRNRGRNTYNAQLGGTRYDTEEESVNGVNARFSIERQLSPQTLFGISVSRDLRDQSLDLVDSLIDSGAGAEADRDGLFDETRLDLNYGLTSASTTFDLTAGVSLSEFRLIADRTGFVSNAAELQDRTNVFAGGSLSHAFTSRTRMIADVNFTQEDYVERRDSTHSILAEAQIMYRLTRSFEAQLGYRVNISDGQRTRDGASLEDALEKVGSVENRVIVGLRWAPPSRASKDLTIQLKSLLQ